MCVARPVGPRMCVANTGTQAGVKEAAILKDKRQVGTIQFFTLTNSFSFRKPFSVTQTAAVIVGNLDVWMAIHTKEGV